MASILDLPNELYLEITQSFPSAVSFAEPGVVHDKHDYRADTLRALSQTCVALRKVFLPMLWRSFGAYFNSRNRRRKPRTREKMLERRMMGLRKATHLHAYVRKLAVTVEECNEDNWQGMAEFLSVLNLLPNLDSLVILSLVHYPAILMQSTLFGKKFPNITSLTIAMNAAPTILAFFPHLEELSAIGGCNPYIVESLGRVCPGLRTLRNYLPSAPSRVYGAPASPAGQAPSKELVGVFSGLAISEPDANPSYKQDIDKAWPKLENISLNGRFPANTLEALKLRILPNLRTLTIFRAAPSTWEKPEEIPTAEQLRDLVSETRRKLVLRVHHLPAGMPHNQNGVFEDKVDVYHLG
ncbi:hypothetical protein HMN09_01307500 [Mycena chlorophos]|uniref:F-box domain-containing protein n=1 Tax=Mycena chlorophos TaxID=658473 RepID=A0A8H6S0K6_MYCCL|nr:hypothetical protein HMN09_01307500 [Mycena chlorophos]